MNEFTTCHPPPPPTATLFSLVLPVNWPFEPEQLLRQPESALPKDSIRHNIRHPRPVRHHRPVRSQDAVILRQPVRQGPVLGGQAGGVHAQKGGRAAGAPVPAEGGAEGRVLQEPGGVQQAVMLHEAEQHRHVRYLR
jgi:hypothetical protein